MPRKTVIIISIIFSIIIIGLFVGAFLIARDEGGPVGETLRDLFPFGQAPEGERRPPKREEGPEFPTPEVVDEEALPQLRQLTSVPVAGFRSLSDGSTTTVRYMERRTGHTYEYALNTDAPRRLTNTTIPAVREAVWSSIGAFVAARYLDEQGAIKTFIGELNIATTTVDETGEPRVGVLDGSFLPDGIAFFRAHPDDERYFYLLRSGGNALGIVGTFGEADEVRVLDSPFTEWAATWAPDDSLVIAPKPSAEMTGVAYLLDTNTGAQERLFGGQEGLAVHATPYSDALVYSLNSGTRVELRSYSLTDGELSGTTAYTLTEKCAWERNDTETVYCGTPITFPSADYPDEWHQGKLFFNDIVEAINTRTNSITRVFTLPEMTDEKIDIVDPEVSENGRYFFFRNKRDGTLWALRLE